MTNENKQFEKNKIIKEEPKKIKSPNCIDKNNFKKISTIIDSNKFNYKNKIGEFKYTDIKDLINDIKDNIISETNAKKLLNALNKIKKTKIIKYKKHTHGHKKLLNLFNKLLNIILTNKTSESQENEKVESKKEENEDEDYEYENEDENKKIKDENKYENEDEDYDNKNEYEYENEDDDNKTIDQNEIIKEKNDHLDEIIDKSKPFENQIESLKKNLIKNLDYYYDNDFDDKELKYKYFKIKLAHLSNEINEVI